MQANIVIGFLLAVSSFVGLVLCNPVLTCAEKDEFMCDNKFKADIARTHDFCAALKDGMVCIEEMKLTPECHTDEVKNWKFVSVAYASMYERFGYCGIHVKPALKQEIVQYNTPMINSHVEIKSAFFGANPAPIDPVFKAAFLKCLDGYFNNMNNDIKNHVQSNACNQWSDFTKCFRTSEGYEPNNVLSMAIEKLNELVQTHFMAQFSKEGLCKVL